jgi:hypothetical protein
MRRKTFDMLLSGAGLLIAAVLVIAGGLLMWSHSFIDSQVHDQLAAQKIFFPAANSPAVAGAQFAPMRQYGGQQLTNGAQAKTYADFFIANHLAEVAGGKTYSEVSAAAQADPTNAALQAQVNTLFKGNTLRGLLLNAYAFWKMAQIAALAALVSFVGAALMLLLTLLGIWHSRKVSPDAEILAPKVAVPATA